MGPSTSAVGSHDLDSGGASDRCSDEGETGEGEADCELDLFAASDKRLACGSWQGSKGTSYTISLNTKGQGDWICSRYDTHGNSKSFTLFYDWEYDLIWWGTAGAYFASASELHGTPDCLRWYAS